MNTNGIINGNDIAALTANYVAQLQSRVKFGRANGTNDAFIAVCLRSDLNKVESRTAPKDEFALARHKAQIAAHKQVIASI